MSDIPRMWRAFLAWADPSHQPRPKWLWGGKRPYIATFVFLCIMSLVVGVSAALLVWEAIKAGFEGSLTMSAAIACALAGVTAILARSVLRDHILRRDPAPPK